MRQKIDHFVRFYFSELFLRVYIALLITMLRRAQGTQRVSVPKGFTMCTSIGGGPLAATDRWIILACGRV